MRMAKALSMTFLHKYSVSLHLNVIDIIERAYAFSSLH